MDICRPNNHKKGGLDQRLWSFGRHISISLFGANCPLRLCDQGVTVLWTLPNQCGLPDLFTTPTGVQIGRCTGCRRVQRDRCRITFCESMRRSSMNRRRIVGGRVLNSLQMPPSPVPLQPNLLKLCLSLADEGKLGLSDAALDAIELTPVRPAPRSAPARPIAAPLLRSGSVRFT